MAGRKPKSKAAAKSAALKKSSARKPAAKSSARKSVKIKHRKARERVVPAKRVRPKQRVAISHHRDEDFKTDGLRAYAMYRDLGIADATHGLAQAHVIRLIGPCDPA